MFVIPSKTFVKLTKCNILCMTFLVTDYLLKLSILHPVSLQTLLKIHSLNLMKHKFWNF